MRGICKTCGYVHEHPDRKSHAFSDRIYYTIWCWRTQEADILKTPIGKACVGEYGKEIQRVARHGLKKHFREMTWNPKKNN